MTRKQIVTFVFTDIENSTFLVQKLREAYPSVLERHRVTIRKALEKYKGEEIDTAGDGFFMIFENPKCAVLAAIDVQRKFFEEEWSASIGLKVRMGMHTGEALSTEAGFTGLEVHLASRICDAAYGGQVLVSQNTKEYLHLEKDCKHSLASLGDYILKDFDYPIELFQLNIEGIKHDFPEPRVAPDVKKIAVLPFAVKAEDKTFEYVGEGMAEEIIVALGKVKGLRVVSRSSSFAMKGKNMDASQIGKILSVSSVLEGRIKAINSHFNISVELVDTNSGLNIWSDSYDSSKEHLINIQSEIAKEVTEAMKCGVTLDYLNSSQYRQTLSEEAYDFYLRGRRFYLQFSENGINLALQMFEKAIETDDTYALAYAGIADCYSFQYQHKIPSREIIVKAAKVSKKAIELAPGLAEVHVSRGIVMSLIEKFEEAEDSFQHAIEMNPSLFLGWFHYGRMCFTAGKLDKAARLFEQANRVEPEDYQSILLSAQAYSDIGCTKLAKTLRNRGVQIAEIWLELNPGDTRALYLSANALVFLDQREKSLDFLKRALSLEPNDSMLLYNVSCGYALLGMKPEALSCLERAHSAGLTLLGWYENDSNLDSLRNESRFVKLLELMRK